MHQDAIMLAARSFNDIGISILTQLKSPLVFSLAFLDVGVHCYSMNTYSLSHKISYFPDPSIEIDFFHLFYSDNKRDS